MREPFITLDGVEHCNSELALADLLREEVLFCNSRVYLNPNGSKAEETVLLFVVANDVFVWGCADAEPFTLDEIGPLWRAWHLDKKWGVVRWLCKHRNEQPQAPVARDMRAHGAWSDEMESLPDNGYDARCRERARA